MNDTPTSNDLTPPRPTRRPARGLLPLAAALGAGLSLVGCAGGRGGSWSPPANYAAPVAQQMAEASRLAADAQQADAESRRLAESKNERESSRKRAEAIRLYREATEAYREYAAAWHNLGVLLLENGEALEAAGAFRTAADLDPRDPRPLYNLGVLWQERGYAEDALRYYGEALGRDESYLPALRYAIRLDRVVLNRYDETTERRIRQALLLERDPRWKEFFLREQTRVAGRERSEMFGPR